MIVQFHKCLALFAMYEQTMQSRMMALRRQQKNCISLGLEIEEQAIFHKNNNISAIVKPILTRFVSKMIMPLPSLSWLCIQALIISS